MKIKVYSAGEVVAEITTPNASMSGDHLRRIIAVHSKPLTHGFQAEIYQKEEDFCPSHLLYPRGEPFRIGESSSMFYDAMVYAEDEKKEIDSDHSEMMYRLALEAHSNKVKEEFFKIYEVIRQGDYQEGEIEDMINDLCKSCFPEEFVE